MVTRTTRIRPSLDKWYWVSELMIWNVIMAVIKKHCLTPSELKMIHLLNKSFSIMVPKVTHWLKIDFYPLHEPRYIHRQQECIDTQQVDMASTTKTHFGLDPGKLVRFLGGEYTQDISETYRKPFKQFETMFHPKIWRIWNAFCWMVVLLI
jgi:hypothetical protein